MKILFPLILCLVVCAFSSKTYWTDENGCVYCLSGKIEGGKCMQTGRTAHPQYVFAVKKMGGKFFKIDYEYKSNLHVFCKRNEDYCNTISDSMVVKLMPSLKKRKSFCKEQSKSLVNMGMFYSIPIKQDDVEFLCDFVNVDYEKSLFEVLETGTCPVRVKGYQDVSFGNYYDFYNLYITKGKTVELKKEILFVQSRKRDNLFGKELITLQKGSFFTIGTCSNSNCEMLNYFEDQIRNFDIKCDFIKKNDNRVGEVTVLREGTCPIEIIDENKEKLVYYVRSVKNADGYKLLMTNKRK